MVELLAKQNVKTIVATPHFYANRIGISEFIEKRNKAYDELIGKIKSNDVEILLGAEVKYYEGISRLENLNQLCIEKSNLLLLEMPFARWTEFEIKELLELSCLKNITVVIAHIERYIGFQNKSTIKRLRENGVLIQTNANFFTGFFTKHKACSMFKNGEIQFIGSDCHGSVYRPPHIAKAYETIRKKHDSDFFEEYCSFIESFFDKK